MVRNWVLDDFQQLFLRVGGSYGQLVKELNHEASEAFEGTWYADGRADFNEDSFGGMNINLKLPGFVDWRVEKSEQALGCRKELVSG
jgi:hypothetical protein